MTSTSAITLSAFLALTAFCAPCVSAYSAPYIFNAPAQRGDFLFVGRDDVPMYFVDNILKVYSPAGVRRLATDQSITASYVKSGQTSITADGKLAFTSGNPFGSSAKNAANSIRNKAIVSLLTTKETLEDFGKDQYATAVTVPNDKECTWMPDFPIAAGTTDGKGVYDFYAGQQCDQKCKGSQISKSQVLKLQYNTSTKKVTIVGPVWTLDYKKCIPKTSASTMATLTVLNGEPYGVLLSASSQGKSGVKQTAKLIRLKDSKVGASVSDVDGKLCKYGSFGSTVISSSAQFYGICTPKGRQGDVYRVTASKVTTSPLIPGGEGILAVAPDPNSGAVYAFTTQSPAKSAPNGKFDNCYKLDQSLKFTKFPDPRRNYQYLAPNEDDFNAVIVP